MLRKIQSFCDEAESHNSTKNKPSKFKKRNTLNGPDPQKSLVIQPKNHPSSAFLFTEQLSK